MGHTFLDPYSPGVIALFAPHALYALRLMPYALRPLRLTPYALRPYAFDGF